MFANTRSKTNIKSLKQLLSKDIRNESILFITGAGISEESGVPLYRSESKKYNPSIIWNSFVEDWCTLEKFNENPLLWYQEFWNKTHNNSKVKSSKPNVAHYFLAELIQKWPNQVKIITQNVDGLHRKANTRLENLIEAHGNIDYYRCVNFSENCTKSYTEPIYKSEICYTQDVLTKQINSKNSQKFTTPLCPRCMKPCMPMLLTFSDSYNSHSFFDWTKAKKWILTTDIIIFIGTSFSVTLTDFALLCSYIKSQRLIYSINLVPKSNIEFNFTENQYKNVQKMWSAIQICLSKLNWTLEELSGCIESASDQIYSFDDTIHAAQDFPSLSTLSSINKPNLPINFLKSIDIEEFFYIFSTRNWDKLDEHSFDPIMITDYYKNVCNLIVSAAEFFQHLKTS